MSDQRRCGRRSSCCDGLTTPPTLGANACSAAGWLPVFSDRNMCTRHAAVVPHLDPELRVEAVTPATALDAVALETDVFGLLPEVDGRVRGAARGDAVADRHDARVSAAPATARPWRRCVWCPGRMVAGSARGWRRSAASAGAATAGCSPRSPPAPASPPGTSSYGCPSSRTTRRRRAVPLARLRAGIHLDALGRPGLTDFRCVR